MYYLLYSEFRKSQRRIETIIKIFLSILHKTVYFFLHISFVQGGRPPIQQWLVLVWLHRKIFASPCFWCTKSLIDPSSNLKQQTCLNRFSADRRGYSQSSALQSSFQAYNSTISGLPQYYSKKRKLGQYLLRFFSALL